MSIKLIKMIKYQINHLRIKAIQELKLDTLARKKRILIHNWKIGLSQMKEIEKVWMSSDSKKIKHSVTLE